MNLVDVGHRAAWIPVEVELVERARTGDAAAFDQLIRPRIGRLLDLAASILGNESDALDAVQDACLGAWRDLPNLREPDRFEAWLWRVVINRCRSTIRERRRTNVRELAIEDDAMAEIPDGRARPLDDGLVTTDVIRRAFDRLDPDRRTILILHHVEERPVAEIAALLGIPEGTAKWRLHAARRALERAMEVETR